MAAVVAAHAVCGPDIPRPSFLVPKPPSTPQCGSRRSCFRSPTSSTGRRVTWTEPVSDSDRTLRSTECDSSPKGSSVLSAGELEILGKEMDELSKLLKSKSKGGVCGGSGMRAVRMRGAQSPHPELSESELKTLGNEVDELSKLFTSFIKYRKSVCGGSAMHAARMRGGHYPNPAGAV
eukprot:TRINITY_DN250_c0_g1_i8.p1 TRINITY_DN250_c0_g1~~TRINITY_DN250_c0_g1_i8.p1  ORF type:complete len:202 (+),score=44.87 TRINITY_DN250_c0_g1_i8:73-606(+)